jgi:hypothetical protein
LVNLERSMGYRVPVYAIEPGASVAQQNAKS